MPEEKKQKDSEPTWLTSFIDVLFVLIAFFALFLSMSHIDYPPEVSIYFRKGSIFKGNQLSKIALPDISPHFAESVLKKELKDFNVKIEVKDKIGSKNKEIILIFPERILFPFGKASLPSNVPSLNKLAEILKKLPRETKVIIVGHTDSVPVRNGTNWELSVRRAISVVEYLCKKGIPKSMLRAAGVADTQPLVPEKTEKDRALNRRVEIKLLLPKLGGLER